MYNYKIQFSVHFRLFDAIRVHKSNLVLRGFIDKYIFSMWQIGILSINPFKMKEIELFRHLFMKVGT